MLKIHLKRKIYLKDMVHNLQILMRQIIQHHMNSTLSDLWNSDTLLPHICHKKIDLKEVDIFLPHKNYIPLSLSMKNTLRENNQHTHLILSHFVIDQLHTSHKRIHLLEDIILPHKSHIHKGEFQNSKPSQIQLHIHPLHNHLHKRESCKNSFQMKISNSLLRTDVRDGDGKFSSSSWT